MGNHRPTVNDFKVRKQRKQGLLESRKQTFSASKKSVSRFGFYRSSQPTDEITGQIRAAVASRRRRAPITLAPTPWDDK